MSENNKWGLDPKIVEEIKGECRAEFVENLFGETGRKRMELHDQDLKWWCQEGHQKALDEGLENQVVIVYNKQIIDYDKNFIILFERMKERKDIDERDWSHHHVFPPGTTFML